MKNRTELTPRIDALRRNARVRIAVFAALSCATLCPLSSALADPYDQASRIMNRLTGTPPSTALLNKMAGQIQGGDAVGAAMSAMDSTNAESSGFYNVTLKNFAAPWTNRDQSVFVPLNDYTATVIGMIRDDVPFNTLLSADILYTAPTSGAPGYSYSDNNHYQYLDDHAVDLRTALARTTQSSTTGLPAAAIAGVMTTRGGASAFFVAGTNRAMFRFTMLNHLCHDMETVQDTSRPPDRIRQDVSRSPGGDSRIFLNSCIGCHSGMDPMAQAFAYYNFDATQGQLVYTPGQVQAKYTINSNNFPAGYVTPDDHWDNRWRTGPNQFLGWSSQSTGSGNGAQSLGQELAASDAFAQCQVQKVFNAVCFRAPETQSDLNQVAASVAAFKGNYKMKQVFAATAAYCMGN